ncbi:hypothetical protein DFH06DRAFT_1172883 [Mycena polygramma]|nr:hypothetical protein DFH06DRAFT_1172883 [Mycena polygramma]
MRWWYRRTTRFHAPLKNHALRPRPNSHPARRAYPLMGSTGATLRITSKEEEMEREEKEDLAEREEEEARLTNPPSNRPHNPLYHIPTHKHVAHLAPGAVFFANVLCFSNGVVPTHTRLPLIPLAKGVCGVGVEGAAEGGTGGSPPRATRRLWRCACTGGRRGGDGSGRGSERRRVRLREEGRGVPNPDGVENADDALEPDGCGISRVAVTAEGKG